MPEQKTAGSGPRPRLAKSQDDTTARLEAERRRREEEQQEVYEEQEVGGSDRPWRPIALMVLAFLGIGVSVYVTVLHYAHIAPVCSDNGAVNCEVVLTSPQSVFLGIPIPVYGLVYFIGMFVLCIPKLWRTTVWWIPWLRLVGSAVGILFALRLIYEELFVIRKLCLWCTSAHVLSFLMFVVIVTGWIDATQNVIPRRTRAAS